MEEVKEKIEEVRSRLNAMSENLDIVELKECLIIDRILESLLESTLPTTSQGERKTEDAYSKEQMISAVAYGMGVGTEYPKEFEITREKIIEFAEKWISRLPKAQFLPSAGEVSDDDIVDELSKLTTQSKPFYLEQRLFGAKWMRDKLQGQSKQ